MAKDRSAGNAPMRAPPPAPDAHEKPSHPELVLRVRKAKQGSFWRAGIRFEHPAWTYLDPVELGSDKCKQILDEPMLESSLQKRVD